MPTQILPYIEGAGGALAVLVFGLYLLITGKLLPDSTHRSIVADKDKQIADLTRAVELERQRAEAATMAASASRDVLLALQQQRPLRHREG